MSQPMSKTAQAAEASLAALIAEHAKLKRYWELVSDYAEKMDDAELHSLLMEIETEQTCVSCFDPERSGSDGLCTACRRAA